MSEAAIEAIFWDNDGILVDTEARFRRDSAGGGDRPVASRFQKCQNVSQGPHLSLSVGEINAIVRRMADAVMETRQMIPTYSGFRPGNPQSSPSCPPSSRCPMKAAKPAMSCAPCTGPRRRGKSMRRWASMKDGDRRLTNSKLSPGRFEHLAAHITLRLAEIRPGNRDSRCITAAPPPSRPTPPPQPPVAPSPARRFRRAPPNPPR